MGDVIYADKLNYYFHYHFHGNHFILDGHSVWADVTVSGKPFCW